MGNRGFGLGGRGVIQTSICLIDDCIGEMLETKKKKKGGIRTAACSVPKAQTCMISLP
jgi:hypothetical protein